jgi:hypothetical protein
MQLNVLMMYHHYTSVSIGMQAAMAAKQHWLNLTALAKLIDAYGQKCEAYKDYVDHLLANCDRTLNHRTNQESKQSNASEPQI